MRMEFVVIALLVVAAFFASRRVKVSVKVERNDAEKSRLKVRHERDHFREEFLNKALVSFSGIFGDMAEASRYVVDTRNWRSYATGCAWSIERELSEQDKSGFVTSGSELNVIKGNEYLNVCERHFIQYQQKVHLHAERVRDHIYTLQTLSKECSDWAKGKSDMIREEAGRLCMRIDSDTVVTFNKTAELLVDADKDPIGIEDKDVTPKVIEFRKELAALRSKIRCDLVAEAKQTLNIEKK